MLRRILISLGLFVAFLPYLGLPHSWQAIASTVIGFLIVAILFFSRKSKPRRGLSPQEEQPAEAKALHVEHMEIVERPEVHVERETVIDTERVQESADTETTVEKKVTVMRRRRKSEVEEKSSSVTE